MAKLAGRCRCGVVQKWVDAEPDDHLQCIGLKWCKRRCGALLGLSQKCRCLSEMNPAQIAAAIKREEDRGRQKTRREKQRRTRAQVAA